MRAELRDVNPEMAAKFVEMAHTVRSPSKETVTRYANDMLAGRWFLTHQALGFSLDGKKMYDGLHRCLAVIESGVTVKMWLYYGLDEKSLTCVDSGRARSLSHISKFLGIDTRAAATTKLFKWTWNIKKVSTGEILEVYKEHKDAIDFGIAHTSLGDRLYYHANILAGILARAWYKEDRDKLAEFSGLVVNATEPNTAILSQWYYGSGRNKGGGRDVVKEVFTKTQNALAHYLRGIKMRQLKGNESDLFPIPMDATQAA